MLIPRSLRAGSTIVTMLAVSSLLLTGCVSDARKAKQPFPEASSPVQTTAPQPASYDFKAPVLKQTHTVAEMEAITDLRTFAALPYADRLAFALGKNPHIEVGTPSNDTGFKQPNAIPGYFWYDVAGEAMGDANTLDGAKVISANEYYTTNAPTGELSDSYKPASDAVLQQGGEHVSIGTTDVFVDSGKWQSGNDRAGNPIDFINITSYSADDSTGARKGPDTTYQTLRQEVKLLDGRTVIVYPRAYGAEGKVSPVEGGTY